MGDIYNTVNNKKKSAVYKEIFILFREDEAKQ